MDSKRKRKTGREMTGLSLEEFISALSVQPVLKIVTLLVIGVILVNGWTDAPNAITSIVVTGEMKLKDAVRMAAVCNFAGLFFMSLINTKVAFTIYNIADFGSSRQEALTALCAALIAIILWAALAWSFGIPTSESHALIAGICGAAIAIHHGTGGIHRAEWIKVLYGLLFSVVLGLSFGWFAGKIVKSVRLNLDKSHQNELKMSKWLQRIAAAAMAFMHGAQDGQKFIGVFLLGICLAQGKQPGQAFAVPVWMMLLSSLLMALGTMMGGERIINTVGRDMIQLDKKQGIAADIAGGICLLLVSLCGIPVSTTHVKTTSLIGVGLAEGSRKNDRKACKPNTDTEKNVRTGESSKDKTSEKINYGIITEMFLTWMITFPCCGIIGYLAAGIFMYLIHTP